MKRRIKHSPKYTSAKFHWLYSDKLQKVKWNIKQENDFEQNEDKIITGFYWISLNLSYRVADIKKKKKQKHWFGKLHKHRCIDDHWLKLDTVGVFFSPITTLRTLTIAIN